MEPSLSPGRFVIINKIGKNALHSGDIVVFRTDDGKLAIKRCAQVLKDGRFIALGDNSLQSYDSRAYGPVRREAIVGRVLIFQGPHS
jgi:phage repressor protein C with HTH and peptisase S24 domain